ncbi:LuxR family transcriptional regulator [Adlercreutzia sp. R25]|uniref:LuxR family transcriptional regulator n=1 Tax=Adlercreutzia shanghongiae TaxID=3111773 RepID=A0ABU6IXN6_9ACTN|nr:MULTISPECIES: LuxR family transcriptional regulator [unclassified Adlercreutzia]MEC4272659.1 LuxR family transcriptional regulator [Adlercreutzia sp. R25]MEC4294440.1 LuxR family transcriptional regulator [Adlercreutzia sp. R22]
MTQSITGSTPVTEGAFTEKTMRGMLGYTLFITSQLICLYSPVLVTESTSGPVVFCLLRALSLLCAALTYFALTRRMRGLDRLVRARGLKAGCTLAQLIVPALVAFEMATGAVPPLALFAIGWVVWGCARALLTCSWVDAKSNLEESYASKISFWSYAAAACLLSGMMLLSHWPALAVLVITMAASCLLLMAAPTHTSAPMDTQDEQWMRNRSSFSPRGSFSMLVDGMLVGFSSGLILIGVLRDSMPLILVGAGFIGSAVLFALLQRFKAEALSLSRGQLVFLPVIVGCLVVMSYSKSPVVSVVAIVLFIVAYLFDFVNHTSLSLRGNLLSVSPSYCYSRGRLYIVAGQALGWSLAAFLLSSVGHGAEPYVATLLVVLVCLHIAISAKPDEMLADRQAAEQEAAEAEALHALEEEAALQSAATEVSPEIAGHRFKSRCLRAAQDFDLTPREAEILSYLARGRNAKYIADQLFVAERTIKTHTYHIYQKMEIHSQQELIDIVEDSGNAGEGRFDW